MKVRQGALEAIGYRRVDRASRLVTRPEHEVVNQQLRAAAEELGQGPRPVVGGEPVLLLDRHPGQLAALARQLVPHPGVLLLALQQLVTSGLPLVTADDLVIRHRVLPPFKSSCGPTPRRARRRRTPRSRVRAP